MPQNETDPTDPMAEDTLEALAGNPKTDFPLIDDDDGGPEPTGPPAPGKEDAGPEHVPASEDRPADGEDDEFGPDLLSEAAFFGVSEDRARSFGSAENLESYISALQLRGGSAAPEHPPALPPPSFDQPAAPLEYKEIQLEGLNEVDEELRGPLSNMLKHLNDVGRANHERMTKAEQKLVERERKDAMQAALRDEQTFESVLTKHPEYKRWVGEGSADSLPANGVAMQWRKKVYNTFLSLRAGAAVVGAPMQSTEEYMRRALLAEFGHKAEEVARQKINGKVDKRAGQMMGTPGRRMGTVPAGKTPEERALNELRNLMK